MHEELARLLFGSHARTGVRHLAIVAAHPDDEAIGLGAQLPQLAGAWLIHITDGAPANLDDAIAAGAQDRPGYAELRRNEMASALALCGWELNRWLCLKVSDQEAAFSLVRMARELATIFRRHAIARVLTHAYEGGHPDHDATAFAVHSAGKLLAPNSPQVFEMTSYHRAQGGFCAGAFIPAPDAPVVTIPLSPNQQAFKRALFACFPSQKAVLAQFSIHQPECFRRAPAYNFDSFPGLEPPYYEWFPWGMNAPLWHRLCRDANAALSHPAQFAALR